MNPPSILRAGGLASVASALLYLGSMVLWMSAGAADGPPALATTIYIASTLLFLITLYALYQFHRAEAPTWSPVICLILGVSLAASLFVDPTDPSSPLTLLLTLLYGVGSLGLGWLAYQNNTMPRGIAWLLLVVGAVSLIMLPFILMQNEAVVGGINLVIGLVYVIWLFWLGAFFLRGQAVASVRPA